MKIFPAWFRHYFLSERDVYSLPWMDSPSLVHFYGADERPTEAGVEYLLVMSRVAQGTLHDFLQANTLQFQQMCRMALTAVRGLAHLHTPIDRHGESRTQTGSGSRWPAARANSAPASAFITNL